MCHLCMCFHLASFFCFCLYLLTVAMLMGLKDYEVGVSLVPAGLPRNVDTLKLKVKVKM